MTGKEFAKVRNTVECEGFEYAFINYSMFDEIEDKEFHNFRKAYIEAANALADYIGVEI